MWFPGRGAPGRTSPVFGPVDARHGRRAGCEGHGFVRGWLDGFVCSRVIRFTSITRWCVVTGESFLETEQASILFQPIDLAPAYQVGRQLRQEGPQRESGKADIVDSVPSRPDGMLPEMTGNGGGGSSWSSSDAPTVGGSHDADAATWDAGLGQSATQPPVSQSSWTPPGSAGHGASPSASGSTSGARQLAPGTLVHGNYRIQQQVGAGAMGAVYLAVHETLGRRVALKIHLSELPTARTRTLREAQAMARLSHPNVVTIYDVGEAQGGIVIAMEYLPGGTARDWMRTARPWTQTVAFFMGAARGLVAAHGAGLVHRDFKPENIMIDGEGRPKVADFGIARAADEMSTDGAGSPVPGLEASPGDAMAATLTQTGAFMGTPAYMAPEQFAGSRVDARADQFAFCVALWEALFGVRPFPGRTPVEVYMAMRERRFAPTPSSSVPGAVRAALVRGLALDPATRYRDMHELIATFEGIVARKRITRVLVPVAIATVVLLGVAGGAYAVGKGRGAASERAADAPFAVAASESTVRDRDDEASPPDQTVEATPTDTTEASPTDPPTRPPPPLAEAETAGFRTPTYWNGEGQFKCHPKFPKVELRDRTIVIGDDSAAMWIAGDCEVRIINCDISGKIAVDIGGDTKVHIEDSILRAEIHAVDIGGNAEVTVKNTKLVGTPADSAFKAGGYAKMTLENMTIKAPVPVELFGPATLRVDGGKLIGSTNALVSRSASSIKLRGVEVVGPIDQWNGAPVQRLPAGADWDD